MPLSTPPEGAPGIAGSLQRSLRFLLWPVGAGCWGKGCVWPPRTLPALSALQAWIPETTQITQTRVSSGNHQGAPIPGKHTCIPRKEGWSVAGSGKKWEMTH